MNNNNPFLGSAHRDVLDASPTSIDDKKKLVEEIKNRGRGAVMASAFPDAAVLYQKGVEVADYSPQDQAIFYANLSLVQRNMGEMEKARRAAQSATELDATYVKGWWRLGQALQSLHRTAEALEALNKAKELEPQNKALIKECTVLAKKIEEEKALLGDDFEAMQVDDPVETKSETTKTTSSSRSSPKSVRSTESSSSSSSTTATTATSSTKSSSSVVVTEEDDNLFKKSDIVKGYKTVNGKKTSYFHKELSEEEKRLIGDIAPKKLDDTATATTNGTTAAAPTAGGSAWNQAGTWEERDVTAWAEETLKQQLLKATFAFPDSSPAPGAVARIAAVSTLTGHASFAIARGKKRYIYEFSAKLKWELALPDGSTEAACSGTMSFPDIDGTCELGEGYDLVDYTVDTRTTDSLTPLLDRFVKNGGLRESIHQQIDDWVRLFRETY